MTRIEALRRAIRIFSLGREGAVIWYRGNRYKRVFRVGGEAAATKGTVLLVAFEARRSGQSKVVPEDY